MPLHSQVSNDSLAAVAAAAVGPIETSLPALVELVAEVPEALSTPQWDAMGYLAPVVVAVVETRAVRLVVRVAAVSS
jgi:hypothetical protein